MKTIGDRIRTRREELGMSQDELAQKLGYKSRSSINKIESGERNLTQSKIKSIADALETSPSYIMGWSIDKTYQLIERDLKIKKDDMITHSDQEKELLTIFRELDEESKRQLVLMLAFLKDQNNKK